MKNTGNRNPYQFAEKQILMPDGRTIEAVPMHECAIHHDNRILKLVAINVLFQAVKDLKLLERKGNAEYVHANSDTIKRCELLNFWNYSFCGDILAVLMPDVELEEAIISMTHFNPGGGRIYASRGDTALV